MPICKLLALLSIHVIPVLQVANPPDLDLELPSKEDLNAVPTLKAIRLNDAHPITVRDVRDVLSPRRSIREAF